MSTYTGKYKKTKQRYQSKPSQIKRRGGRVQARRIMERAGKVKKGDGKDVHHKNGDPTDNRLSNLTVRSHKQRGHPGNKHASKKNRKS